MRDGTMWPSGHHTFDLSALDLMIGTAPSAPAVTVQVGTGTATVRWTAPAANGSAISGYRVTASPSGRLQTLPSSSRSTTFTGLANGTAQTFRVIALNVFGTGT